MDNKYLISAGKDGIKSFTLDEYPDDASTWLSGGPDSNEALDLLTKVDWLYRAAELVMISIADIPFYILNKSGDELDSYIDWKNVVGFMADPVKILQLIAGGLFSSSTVRP